jgi:1-acyl-sn-glycerol-3-phosphate acyltransferase
VTRPGDAAPEEASSPQRDPLRQSLLWRTLRMLIRIGATLLFDFKAYGVNHIPRRGGVLLLANHQSLLDPILIATPSPHRPMSFMAKSQLFQNRYFGAFIRALNAFPIKQGAGDVGAMKETIRRLKEGHMLNIYPEGSRTETGEMGPIAPGAALVVRRAGVPIVPVVIEGSFKAWPKGTRMFRPVPISVMYGPAMKVDHLKPQEITELIDRTLRSMFDELRAKRRETMKWRL